MAEIATQAYSPLVGELVEPVPGEHPAGADIKYDDVFLELKAEVDRFGAAGEVDFEKMVALATGLLREKSKDLTTAGYLTLGLMRTKGVEGLAEGWAVTEALVTRYWEQGLHPEKPVRRRNALQFMADRSRDWVQARQEQAPTVEERGPLEAALEAVKALQGRTMEALKQDAPALSGVAAALSERLRRTPEPEPEPQAQQDASTGAAEGGPSEAEAAGAASDAQPAEEEEQKLSFPLVGELVEPMPGEHPAGADIKYDDVFLELKAEVDRFGAAGEVDFEKMVALATGLLREKSKDLTTAGYLTLGLMRTKGVEGLAEGWAVTEALVTRYWEQGLHPEKPVRRRNALQFMADRSRDWVQARQEQAPTVEERGPLEAALEAVKALQGRTMEALKQDAPALSGVAAALSERLRRVPEPEPEPAPEPEAPAEEPRAASAPAAAAPPAASTAAAPAPAAPDLTAAELASSADVGAVLLKITGVLHDEDLTNPLAYRLARAYAWGNIRAMPDHENGMVLFWPPENRKVSLLERWIDQDEHEGVIRTAERYLFDAEPFNYWLTMQRFVVQAMETLGAPYAAAAEAAMEELGLLVRRLPGLLEMSFRDGTPFVDPMTQEWIEMQVMTMFAGDDEAGGGGVQDHVADQFKEARKLLGTGNLQDAIAKMQEGNEHDASQADRFRRRLYLAQLCLRGGQPPVARSVLESLDKEVERHDLDGWDPRLTLEVWTNLYTCYNTLAQTNDYDRNNLLGLAQQVLSKISRLDAGYALNILGAG